MSEVLKINVNLIQKAYEHESFNCKGVVIVKNHYYVTQNMFDFIKTLNKSKAKHRTKYQGNWFVLIN
jgi:hypothetical protein